MASGAAVEISDLGPCKKKLAIVVSKERIQEAFAEDLAELAGSASVPGFRPGHAPRALVEKRFRKNLSEQVRDKLVAEAYQAAIKDNDLDVIGSPDIGEVKAEPDEEIKFDVTVTVKPDVEIDNYKGIELVREAVSVTEKDVDDFLDALRARAARFEAVTAGGTQAGDILKVDTRIVADGSEVFSDKDLHLPLIDSTEDVYGVKIDGLAKAMEGIEPGGERSFEVTFPDDFFLEEHKNTAGTIVITCREISRRVLPEMNEEFVAAIGFDSSDALREYAERAVRERAEFEAERSLRNQLNEKLLSACSFDLPEGFVEASAERLRRRREYEMRVYGATPEQIGEESDRIRNASIEQATRDLKQYFILDKIAATEKIFATDPEVSEAVSNMAARRGVKPARQWHDLEADGSLGELREEIRNSKTISFLLDNAKVEDKGAAPEKEDSAGSPSSPGGEAQDADDAPGDAAGPVADDSQAQGGADDE